MRCGLADEWQQWQQRRGYQSTEGLCERERGWGSRCRPTKSSLTNKAGVFSTAFLTRPEYSLSQKLLQCSTSTTTLSLVAPSGFPRREIIGQTTWGKPAEPPWSASERASSSRTGNYRRWQRWHCNGIVRCSLFTSTSSAITTRPLRAGNPRRTRRPGHDMTFRGSPPIIVITGCVYSILSNYLSTSSTHNSSSLFLLGPLLPCPRCPRCPVKYTALPLGDILLGQRRPSPCRIPISLSLFALWTLLALLGLFPLFSLLRHCLPARATAPGPALTFSFDSLPSRACEHLRVPFNSVRILSHKGPKGRPPRSFLIPTQIEQVVGPCRALSISS